LFLLSKRRRFVAILRLFLTRTRAQFAAETKCARYLGASDGENLSVGISWFTFLLRRVSNDAFKRGRVDISWAKKLRALTISFPSALARAPSPDHVE
jgi:hypothetical protein